MSIGFIFPPARFAETNTKEEQLTHLFSEVKEAFEEIQKGNTEAALLEITDIVHSFETFRRVAPDHADTLIYNTVKKNSDRGYYIHFDITEYQGNRHICLRCGCEVFNKHGKCAYCGESKRQRIPALDLYSRE